VFSLASDGSIGEQLFLEPTTSSGGTANAVAPSEFSDRFVALTDIVVGFVEVRGWQGNGSASVVTHLGIEDVGCCANAVVGMSCSVPRLGGKFADLGKLCS
jgi:carboxy-cis,cis-muconate cyclase